MHCCDEFIMPWLIEILVSIFIKIMTESTVDSTTKPFVLILEGNKKEYFDTDEELQAAIEKLKADKAAEMEANKRPDVKLNVWFGNEIIGNEKEIALSQEKNVRAAQQVEVDETMGMTKSETRDMLLKKFKEAIDKKESVEFLTAESVVATLAAGTSIGQQILDVTDAALPDEVEVEAISDDEEKTLEKHLLTHKCESMCFKYEHLVYDHEEKKGQVMSLMSVSTMRIIGSDNKITSYDDCVSFVEKLDYMHAVNYTDYLYLYLSKLGYKYSLCLPQDVLEKFVFQVDAVVMSMLTFCEVLEGHPMEVLGRLLLEFDLILANQPWRILHVLRACFEKNYGTTQLDLKEDIGKLMMCINFLDECALTVVTHVTAAFSYMSKDARIVQRCFGAIHSGMANAVDPPRMLNSLVHWAGKTDMGKAVIPTSIYAFVKKILLLVHYVQKNVCDCTKYNPSFICCPTNNTVTGDLEFCSWCPIHGDTENALDCMQINQCILDVGEQDKDKYDPRGKQGPSSVCSITVTQTFDPLTSSPILFCL